MSILVSIVRFLVWTLLLSWIVWLVRKAFARASMNQQAVADSRKMPARPLHRDPVCGMYVSQEVSFTLEVASEVHHFCSLECRERYKSTMRRVANG